MNDNNNINGTGGGSTSVVHVDPHLLLRFGVKLLLTSKGECTYVAECGTAEEAFDRIDQLHPHILLLELALKDKSGIEVIRKIRKDKLPTKVLVLSGFEDEATVRQALHAGADGYLFKSSSPEQLLSAVASIRSADRPYVPEAMIHLLEQNGHAKPNGTARNGHFSADPLGKLSKREREVFYLLAEGHPNRVIAKQLFISPRTVETHRARVIRKLGFVNTADLIRYAIRNNLMPL